MRLRGGDDEVAVIGQDGDGEVEVVVHGWWLVEGSEFGVRVGLEEKTALTPALSHRMGEGVRRTGEGGCANVNCFGAVACKSMAWARHFGGTAQDFGGAVQDFGATTRNLRGIARHI